MLLAEDTLPELEEDLLTAWVPDALNWADLKMLVEGQAAPHAHICPIAVPRPGGGSLMAYPLPVELHLELHRSVSHLRDRADAELAPGVCGYRRGSEAGPGYRAEHQRFVDFIHAESLSHAYAATADVANFFRSISRDLVLEAVEEVDTAEHDAITNLLKSLDSAGVVGLPAGYGDARLLSNIVLSLVDRTLDDLSFCRWVDDYRLFAGSLAEAEAAIDSVGAGLDRVGLKLNIGKCHADTSAAMRARIGESLESVFHPEREPEIQTAAALRTVFLRAAVDPVTSRREIRFALRRLRLIGDDVAVDFVVDGLTSMPWELPRIVDYLSAFVDDDRVRACVQSELVHAARSMDHWRMARLLPLAIAVGSPAQTTTSAVAAYAERTPSSAVWGLAVRMLSLAGIRDALDLCAMAPDSRSALAAFADLHVAPPVQLVERAPLTASVLAQDPAPPPSPRSIL